jgi:hypothetical protein
MKRGSCARLGGIVAALAVCGAAVARAADGWAVVAWGSNNEGQCNVAAPNGGFIAVAGGGVHSLGLKADGSIIAWGNNIEGQCDIPAPNSGFVAVAAGYWHSLGLEGNGSIAAWGNSGNVPEPNIGFVGVAGGTYHSLGLKRPTPPGDLNCDGLVNNGDIDAFVMALTNPRAYWTIYPNCIDMLADINGDGLINNGDIDAFVALLTGG